MAHDMWYMMRGLSVIVALVVVVITGAFGAACTGSDNLPEEIDLGPAFPAAAVLHFSEHFINDLALNAVKTDSAAGNVTVDISDSPIALGSDGQV